MTNLGDALASLKAKVQDYTPDEETLALAAGKAVAKATYVFAGINGHWDPKDHPRDPNTGEFVEGPKGFIFGKAKTATFALHGNAKKIDLKPGDVAFKTPAGNVVVSHGDGGYTLHHGVNKVSTIPAGNHSTIAGQVQSGEFKKIGENPGTIVEAGSKAEAAQKIADPSQYGKTAVATLPTVGTTLKVGQPDHPAHGKNLKVVAWPTGSGLVGVEEDSLSENKYHFGQDNAVGYFYMKSVGNWSKTPLDVDSGTYFEAWAPQAETPKIGADKIIIPDPPALKPGKTKFTAKQYKTYQDEAKGVLLAMGANGKPILSGSWVEGPDGKPYLVHASPFGKGKVTAYRWVSTKQQASNLEKEDAFTIAGLATAKAIDDPTGKPYGVEADAAEAAAPKHGSLMQAAVNATIPNTATAHKKHVAEAFGKPLTHASGATDGSGLFITDKNQDELNSGDWVEIDGKPVQVHSSPNEGNVAIAKWVSTKQQASGNTYDFPASVLANAVKIEDPTGKPYAPVKQEESKKVTELNNGWTMTVSDPKVEEPAAGVPDGWVAEFHVKGHEVPYTYEKHNDTWTISSPESVKGIVVNDPAFAEKLEGLAYDPSKKDSEPVDLLDDPWAITQDDIDSVNADATVEVPDEPLAEWEKELLNVPYLLNKSAQSESTLKEMAGGSVISANFGSVQYYLHKDADNTWSIVTGEANGEWQVADDQTISGMLGSADGVVEVFPSGSDEASQVMDNPMNYPVEKTVTMDFATYTWRKDGWYSAEGTPQLAGSADALDDAYETKQALKESIQSMTPGDQLHVTKKTASAKTNIYEKQEDDSYKSLTGSGSGVALSSDYFLKYLDKPLGDKFQWEVVAADEKQGDATPKKQQFVHPVSGAVFLMIPEAKVYKHKTSEGGYIIVNEGEENPINFFTTTGKQQKPKAFQKNLSTAYEVVENWPGKVEVAPEETSADAPTGTVQNPTAEQIENAPAGTVLSFFNLNGQVTATWTKTEDASKWSSASDGTKVSEQSIKGAAGVSDSGSTLLTYPTPAADNDGQIVEMQEPITPGQKLTQAMVQDAAPGDAIYVYKNDSLHDQWAKQESGEWLNLNADGSPMQYPSTLLHSDMVQAANGMEKDNDYGWSYMFYPKGSKAEVGEKEGSPWGSDDAAGTPQVDPEPISTKPEPKSKGKSKKASLPTKVTLANGKEIDLKPGEAYGKVKDDWGSEYYVHVTAGPKSSWTNSNNMYNPDGTPAYWNKASSWTANSLKNAIKKNGGELLGENPVVSGKVDFSQYEKQDLPENTSDINAFILEVRGKFAIKTNYSGNAYPYTSYPQFGDKQYMELDVQEKLSLLADYEALVGGAVASLEPVAKMESLDKSVKQDYGKARSGLTLIHRTAVLARELNNPDTEWDDDRFSAELAFVASKVAKPGVSLSGWFKGQFPISDFYNLLASANNQRQFKNSLTSLDFDPYNATTEEYDTYAKSKGFDYLAALPEDQQKTWVLADLGDPTISQSMKNSIEQSADKAKSKIVIAALAADLQKGHAKSPLEAASAKKTQGIFVKKMLKTSYEWDTGSASFRIENVGDDEWVATTITPGEPESQLDGLSDSVVMVMVNSALEQGSSVTESDKHAYGADNDTLSAYNKISKKYNVDLANADYLQLQGILGSEGGGIATTTSNSSRMRQWLWAKAAGDKIAQFYIEKYEAGGTHPEKGHLGNPESSAGKAAHKALAEYLWQHPAGQKWLQGDTLVGHERVALGEHLGLTNDWVDAGFDDNFSAWRKWHNREVLAEFVNGGFASAGGVATKPINVPEESWTLVNNVDAGTDLTTLMPGDVGVATLTDEELTGSLSASNVVNQSGLTMYLGALPTHIKRLALWGAGGAGDDEYRRGVLASVAAKAKAGEYMTGDTPAWISPSGAKIPLTPGSTVYKSNGSYWSDDNYIILGPPDAQGNVTSGYLYNGNSSPSKISGYQIEYAKGGNYADVVFTLPTAVHWDQAKKDNPDLSKAFWDESTLVDEGKSSKYAHHLTGALLTAELKNNQTLQDGYPNLYALHKHLPENVRQAVASALAKNHDAMLAVLEYKAGKGHYASLGSKGLFDAAQPWLPHLSKGQFSESDVNSQWSDEAKSAYAAHFSISEASIAEHLSSLLNPETPTLSKALPAFKDLVLTKTGKSLGGMHTKHVWVDQDGNEWMSKAFDSDPNAKARVDAETGAVRIGKLFNFRVPAANTQSVPGYSYAYLQHLAPATSDLTGKGPNDLTVKQLGQAMEEHVLDWITANHDTHRQNLMVSPNGDIFGIDKGQAFKHFPNDKLAVGYLPPENGEKVWYDNFYNALKSGQIDKERADEVTKHVLRRAQQISKDKDEEYRAELETALQHRTFWPEQYPSREKFIDGLVERKHNLFNDFVDFYKSLYAASPHEFDIDTENLVPPKLDEHTHISVSTDYAEDVKKSAVHGKAIFFSTTHLEDAHLLMSTAKAQDGTTVLTGEAKIRKDGDKVLSDWLQKQTIESHVGYQQQSYNDYDSTPVDVIDGATLPGNTEWFAAMVAGSKTVSSHNASGDQSYNTGTLQKMDQAHDQVVAALSALADWKEDSTTSSQPFKGVVKGGGQFNNLSVELHTMEQQEAWENLLHTYAGYAEKVNDHKGTDKKISPHFTQVTYTPSKSAQDLIKAKQSGDKDFSAFVPKQIEDILKGAKNGDQITVTTNGTEEVWTKQYGGWKNEGGVNQSSEGMAQKITLLGSKSVFGYSGPVPELPEESDETSTTVTVGTKVLKVVKRPNAQQNGNFNFDTGEQTLTGGETSSFSGYSLSGHMYEIDFGSTVIEYRPWGENVPLAQQGLLRFRKKDWDGDPTSIEEIFDVLRQMGLDLDPATEESMELFYWKHLYGILRDRKDGTTGKWATLHNKIVQAGKDNDSMTDSEELALHREVWSEALGADVVENADWMPKFSRQSLQAQDDEDNHFTSGHPYWHRPDYSIADIKQWMGSQHTATSLTYGGNASDALPIALSGSMLSAEERARYYGSLAKSGASSSSDMGKGSSAMVYTKPKVGNGDYEVYYHPRVLLRTTNYAFDYDAYGDINAKSQRAYWDGQSMHTVTTTELMIKNSVSVMDDVMMLKFANESDRQKAIKAYKDRGITKLHGLPIEEIFVTSTSGLTKVRNHVYAEAMKSA